MDGKKGKEKIYVVYEISDELDFSSRVISYHSTKKDAEIARKKYLFAKGCQDNGLIYVATEYISSILSWDEFIVEVYFLTEADAIVRVNIYTDEEDPSARRVEKAMDAEDGYTICTFRLRRETNESRGSFVTRAKKIAKCYYEAEKELKEASK